MLLQSLSDEFELPKGTPVMPLPASYIIKRETTTSLFTQSSKKLIGPDLERISICEGSLNLNAKMQ